MSHEEYKNTPFEKKQIRQKMKINSTFQQSGTLNFAKRFYCVLMINDIYLMMESTLYNMHRKIQTSCFD